MVGRVLRELRRRKGLTLRELGELAGVSMTFLSDIEHERRMPSVPTLAAVARALGVSPEVFLDGAESGGLGKARTPEQERKLLLRALGEREDLLILVEAAKHLPPEAIDQVVGIIRLLEGPDQDKG